MPVGQVRVPESLLPIFGNTNANEILNLPPGAYKEWYHSIKDSLQCGEKMSLGVLRRKITKRQYAFKQSQAIKSELQLLKTENEHLRRENASLRAKNARLNAELSPTRMHL